jgi:tRNA pseudouridine38-40 synthase
MNYRLILQYDGTEFAGWQVQEGVRTVQGELERALSLLEGVRVVVHGAGRTDAGVHAEAQGASVRLERAWEPEKLRAAVNGNVAGDLRVVEVQNVPDDFHARYSAKGKTYVYRVFNERVHSPFWSRYALHEARALDLEAMRTAARLFVGEHDWTAFSAAQAEVKSRVRNVTALEVSERTSARGRGRLVEIHASAEGFLRYMVRTIAGTLLAVGAARRTPKPCASQSRRASARNVFVTAPAHGLTLVEVRY